MPMDSRSWSPAIRPRATVETQVRTREESVAVRDKVVRGRFAGLHGSYALGGNLAEHFRHVYDLGLYGVRHSTTGTGRIWTCMMC
jgi:hypothetical protein